MLFSNYQVSSPQTARELARLHVTGKVLDKSKRPTLMSLLHLEPRKPQRPRTGYRRVVHTAPPSELPTLRRLSLARRGHSTPDHIPSANDSLQDRSLRTSRADQNVSQASPVPASAAGPAASAPKKNVKPYMYRDVRSASGQPPRCASSRPDLRPGTDSAGLTAVLPVEASPSSLDLEHKPTSAARAQVARAGPPRRREGKPVFADENSMRAALDDILRLEKREAQEERLLEELLSGRVVGGEGMYCRVKVVAESERSDASPAWMTTLFSSLGQDAME